MILTRALSAFAKTKYGHRPRRRTTIGASVIGTCARKIWFSRNDTAVDPDFVDRGGAALRGTLFEKHFWVPALRARFGDKLLFAGGKQRTFRSGQLSATPDGLLIDQARDALIDLHVDDIGPSGCIVVEGKTVDPRVALNGRPKPEHEMQLNTQLGVVSEKTEHKPEWAVISYVNCSFYDDTVEFVHHFDAAAFEFTKARAAKILAATAADELRPEGYIAGGHECETCPFTQACGVIRHAVPTGPPGGTARSAGARRADRSCPRSSGAPCPDRGRDLRSA